MYIYLRNAQVEQSRRDVLFFFFLSFFKRSKIHQSKVLHFFIYKYITRRKKRVGHLLVWRWSAEPLNRHMWNTSSPPFFFSSSRPTTRSVNSRNLSSGRGGVCVSYFTTPCTGSSTVCLFIYLFPCLFAPRLAALPGSFDVYLLLSFFLFVFLIPTPTYRLSLAAAERVICRQSQWHVHPINPVTCATSNNPTHTKRKSFLVMEGEKNKTKQKTNERRRE